MICSLRNRQPRNNVCAAGVGGGGGSMSRPRKPPQLITKLPTPLEELYRGATRKMKISRNVTNAQGQTERKSEVLEVKITPGWKAGTKVRQSLQPLWSKLLLS